MNDREKLKEIRRTLGYLVEREILDENGKIRHITISLRTAIISEITYLYDHEKPLKAEDCENTIQKIKEIAVKLDTGYTNKELENTIQKIKEILEDN